MARYFRPYAKKRGHRQTGSRSLGNVGLALFFGLFFVGGCVLLGSMIAQVVVPEWRVNQHFIETTCLVLQSRLAERRHGEVTYYQPQVRISYKVGGQLHSPWAYYDIAQSGSFDEQHERAIVEQFVVGRKYTCWYDPSSPGRSVLARGYSPTSWLMLLLPLSFVTIGGGGLVYSLIGWGRSTERRAALTQRARQIELFGQPAGARPLPQVPACTELKESPGTALAYRLPPAATPVWGVAVALAMCLLWNAVVIVFTVIAINAHAQGNPEWFLTLFVLPMAAAGMGATAFFIRQFAPATAIGPTLLEVSAHPLYPGGHYQLYLSQSGRTAMRSLRVLFVCDEHAAYQQGTNTRSESIRVHEQELFAGRALELSPERPLEIHCDLTIPREAMHSFQSLHNHVAWKVIVEADAEGSTPHLRSFAVVVHPPLVYGATG